MLLLTLTMALLHLTVIYITVPVSHDSVTVIQHASAACNTGTLKYNRHQPSLILLFTPAFHVFNFIIYNVVIHVLLRVTD